MQAELILENGARFAGELFGDEREAVGEIIFNTGMVGYQECISDPSYAGQIVAMSFPMIGNYGINSNETESKKAAMKALVVREKCDFPSNFRSEKSLDEFLKEQGVVGLSGIDTRALTRVLRDNGVMKAAIVVGDVCDSEAKARMDKLDNSDVVMRTTAKETYAYSSEGKYNVAFIDMGSKENVMQALATHGAKLTVYPADVSADEILLSKPDLVFVSNGPGNPLDVPGAVDTVRALLGKVAVSGFGMGHQIIGLALGGKTQKLKFGHHGGNQPVRETQTGKVYITSQNHNYILTDLPEGVIETFKNVNDGSCEGICHKDLRVRSVQFYPESVGALDVGYLLDRFLTKED